MTKPKQRSTIFLTGATGLLGSYLLKILLNNNHKVYALARGKTNKTAKARVEEALHFWDKKLSARHNNLTVFEGDLSKRNLGLNQQTIRLLTTNIEQIFHSGAITVQNTPLAVIKKTNVNGTHTVLDLALKCRKKVKVFHVSTAYICGNSREVFTEDDLNKKQHFNSNYEISKFQSEKLVHQYRLKGLLIDVFRPPLIIGESTTGKISEFKNIYQFLAIAQMNLFSHLPLKNAVINCIPVDHCAELIYCASLFNGHISKTLNLCPTKIALNDLLAVASKILCFRKPVLTSKVNTTALTPIQLKILKSPLFAFNFYANLDSKQTKLFFNKQDCKLVINKKELARCIKFYKAHSNH